jgi:hypothetical protein
MRNGPHSPFRPRRHSAHVAIPRRNSRKPSRLTAAARTADGGRAVDSVRTPVATAMRCALPEAVSRVWSAPARRRGRGTDQTGCCRGGLGASRFPLVAVTRGGGVGRACWLCRWLLLTCRLSFQAEPGRSPSPWLASSVRLFTVHGGSFLVSGLLLAHGEVEPCEDEGRLDLGVSAPRGTHAPAPLGADREGRTNPQAWSWAGLLESPILVLVRVCCACGG